MTSLYAIVDNAVDQALKAHPDYLTAKGTEAARKLIVRKVTSALRDSIAAPKPTPEEQAAAKAEPPSEYFFCECWSRPWWALLVRKIDRGKPKDAAFMLQYASRAAKGTRYSVPAGEGVHDDDLANFTGYPSDGEAMKAWRPWFDRHRVSLPEWRGRVWVFLPSPEPPAEAES